MLLLLLLFAAFINLAASAVSCGGHSATSCAECPQGQGAGWCNGNCTWLDDICIGPLSNLVSCGGHYATSCASCPQGQGETWCNGDCTWLEDSCIDPLAPTAAPTETSAPTSTGMCESNSATCGDYSIARVIENGNAALGDYCTGTSSHHAIYTYISFVLFSLSAVHLQFFSPFPSPSFYFVFNNFGVVGGGNSNRISDDKNHAVIGGTCLCLCSCSCLCSCCVDDIDIDIDTFFYLLLSAYAHPHVILSPSFLY